MGTLSIFAQKATGFNGNGYYRIMNNATKRYIYVTDNKDYYDKSHDKEDFQAIQLWTDINRAVSSPGSVIYIEEVSSGSFDLRAQGTGVHSLTGFYVNVNRQSDGTYIVSASRSGVTKYLSDDETSTYEEQGKMGTSGTTKYRKWIVDRITTDHASNYVGIKPTIQIEGTYYQPFYASFPFKAASENMHIYYIDNLKNQYAYVKEIEDVVPGGTPVLIECASADPSQNRIELLTSSSGQVSGNKLSGTYFCNGERPAQSTEAFKKFDANTMRVFSIKDGMLVLTDDASGRIKTVETVDWSSLSVIEIDCLPENTSYLKATAETPKDLTVILPGMGIDEINNNKPLAEGVYSIGGTRLRATNDTEGLPAGLYIVGGKKIAIK